MASRFHDLLSLPRTLFLDGAMGTMLQAGGMPAGVSPSRYCLERPEKLAAVHRAYVEAGSDILTTCTFGASLSRRCLSVSMRAVMPDVVSSMARLL